MANWTDEYDDQLEAREKGRNDLDRYFSSREAELAEREQALREREEEVLKLYHSSEAKAAANAARWRKVQLDITPDMTGDDILKLYKRHGI